MKALTSRSNLEFRGVGCCGGRKAGEPGEKPLEQGDREPIIDSIHETQSTG